MGVSKMEITKAVIEILAERLLRYLEVRKENKIKLDRIAYKVSKNIPMNDEEQYFMKMCVPEDIAKYFWYLVRSSHSGDEFLEAYNRGRYE